MQSALPLLRYAAPSARAHHSHTGSLPLPWHATSPPLLRHAPYPASALPCSSTTCTPVARLALACNPSASALACNPPCLRSGMRPVLPLLQHAIHPASAVASNLPQSGLSSSTSGYTHDPTRPLQHRCLVLRVQHDKPISTTTRQIRPCLPQWAKSLWSTQPLSHARTSLLGLSIPGPVGPDHATIHSIFAELQQG